MKVSGPKCYRYVDLEKAVYLSNATSIKCKGCMNSEGDVYFDKVKIKFTRGNLKQETHYYPFGLPMAGIGSSAMGMTPNRQKYQSNEYITDAGLNWMSFGARQYDPQLGRFLSVDPLAAVGGQDMLSPYQAMGNNPVSSMDPGGTAYYSMENYVDNRGNRFYLSPGTIASLGLPWTGDPTGFTPPPSWDYGAFFDLSADIVTFQFYSAGYARLQKVIQQRSKEKNNNFTALDMILIRAFYDWMPDGSKAVFYANHTYTYDPNYVLVHGRLDGSDLIAGIGPGGGVLGGVLRIFGLDNPLSLILMPTPIAEGMTPAQMMALYQREQDVLDQFNEGTEILRGAGWMSTGNKTELFNLAQSYKKGDNIDLSRFSKQGKRGTIIDPETKEYLEPDRGRNSGNGGHGGSWWKLYSKEGFRIGTISKYGIWLRP